MSRSFFVVIPAAGTGSRFGAGVPKQYLPLNGDALIRHTLSAVLSDLRITRVMVVLSPDDALWDDRFLPATLPGRIAVVRRGGQTRAESVLNGINALKETVQVNSDDWVLVHDAARPCLSGALLTTLINRLQDDPVGGLLAIPVADTLKRADNTDRVVATVDRRQLWQAQTPQMFRLGLLHAALTSGDRSGVTDDASAIEMLGHRPSLVPGSLCNLKVTYPEDLALAETILAAAQPRI